MDYNDIDSIHIQILSHKYNLFHKLTFGQSSNLQLEGQIS